MTAKVLLNYSAPFWLPGGHGQTIWPALWGAGIYPFGYNPSYIRERWVTPDHDFIDIDWQYTGSSEQSRLIVLFHGLEGSSAAPYSHLFSRYSKETRSVFAVPHFRGCSGEINQRPRAYHSGDHEEINWILRSLRKRYTGPIIAIGISLGGNALLRWTQEFENEATNVIDAAIAICAPLDLAASGRALASGFNHAVYAKRFLRTMKPKALKKLEQFPGLVNRKTLKMASDLYAFDNVFTAPLHGFKNTDDYWSKASARPHMHAIKVPSLVINPLNDPFVPASCLPTYDDVSKFVTLWQPAHGGHVGFPAGLIRSGANPLANQVGAWLHAQGLG